jgi:hypothetical protein
LPLHIIITPTALPLLRPNLALVVELPDEMCANFMVQHTLNRVRAVKDRQSNDDPALVRLVAMNHPRRSDSICLELESYQLLKLKLLDVLLKQLCNLLLTQQLASVLLAKRLLTPELPQALLNYL